MFSHIALPWLLLASFPLPQKKAIDRLEEILNSDFGKKV
jgi:hypothetical protein